MYNIRSSKLYKKTLKFLKDDDYSNKDLKNNSNIFKTVFMSWGRALIEAVIVILVLFCFFWPLRINGASMEPVFKSNDRVVISRVLTWINSIDYSDIVVCTINDNNENVNILKRVVGLPGDSIKIVKGKIYINNRLFEEDYVLYNSNFNLEEVVLEEDEFFLMGDNRRLSFDSRHIGAISRDSIIGKVVLRWFPLYKIELF